MEMQLKEIKKYLYCISGFGYVWSKKESKAVGGDTAMIW